jgi:hypothetical protein
MTQYIIDFINTATTEQVNEYVLANGMLIVTEFDKLGKVYLVETSSTPTVGGIVESVIDNSASNLTRLTIDSALNSPVRTQSIDLADNKNWWKAASIYSADLTKPAENCGIYGTGVRVYVMDSGIESTHPEFVGVNITNLFSFTGDFTDTTGHGTSMASLIAGNTCSLTDASIQVVKIFDQNVATKLSDMLSAFNAIVTDFTANGNKGAVVNVSWSIPFNQYINDKVSLLGAYGIYVVVAAGNDGQPITNVSPATVPTALVVGAYNQNLAPCDFSAYTGGSIIDLTAQPVNFGELDGWAPGEYIWAAGLDGTYGYIAGTSASAAITSGALAYNLSVRMVNSTGTWFGVKPTVKNVTTQMGKLSLSKQNLLTLAANYSNSINKIVSYLTNPGDVNLIPTANKVDIGVIRSGRAFAAQFVDPLTVSRISSTQDLPTGLSLDNGFIVGTVPPITSDYELFTIDLVLTLFDSTTINIQLSGSIVRADITKADIEALLAGDPTLPITLLGIPCYNKFTSVACQNTPGGHGYVSCDDKNGTILSNSSKDNLQCRWATSGKTPYCMCSNY